MGRPPEQPTLLWTTLPAAYLYRLLAAVNFTKMDILQMDLQGLRNMYEASCTDDGSGDVETYEAWLERQLLRRVDLLHGSKERGNLMCRVMIRSVADKRDGKGNIIFQERELFNWFENGEYLKKKSETDAL